MTALRDLATGQSGNVVPVSPLTTKLLIGGIPVPDQATMHLMMRATAVGLPWSSSEADIKAVEARIDEFVPFHEFTLDDYIAATKRTSMTAQTFPPIPIAVAAHIDKLEGTVPGAEVRIHAHPTEDPFVEITAMGESLFTMAWRPGINGDVFFPRLEETER